MSFQTARTNLAEALRTLTEPSGWMVTTETDPDIYHQLIVVGHPDTIEPETFRMYTAKLDVTLWVSEADSIEGVDQLYALISPDSPSTILFALAQTAPIAGQIDVSSASRVGRRREGPSGFLAADINVGLRITWT